MSGRLMSACQHPAPGAGQQGASPMEGAVTSTWASDLNEWAMGTWLLCITGELQIVPKSTPTHRCGSTCPHPHPVAN